ncbi:O-antigen ligase domain-containing protein [Leptospira fluminis]|uniref:O-antigen ligase domain-containing protein n=1 Tax=Leptospira fluminis TaxID=2484979 RepID=A0A4R9GKS9_9LEPT|nr:O-antigen ligase family protein [Leptospira fluminis]TGK14791.1 O-antigen ligase domain-containing protein [Leptospira fluminis]
MKIESFSLDRIESGTLSRLSEKGSFYSLLFLLITFPLSVSVSQIFAGLAVFLFLAAGPAVWKKSRPFLLPFALILGAYFLVFLSSAWHSDESGDFWKNFARQSEAGDFWLCLVFPVGAAHATEESNSSKIGRFIWISFFLLLLSGLISIFSEYRLGKFISNGFKYAPGDRKQHPAGLLLGILSYLPIGLMNTHLTYGGLLSLYVPGLAAGFFASIRRKSGFRIGFYGILFLVASWLFLLNQSKSAWLGVGFVCVYLLLRFMLRGKIGLSSRNVAVAGLAVCILFACIGFSFKYLYETNWLFHRTVSQVLEVQTPENQRYWIYKNSLPLLEKTYAIGVGGGKFKSAHRNLSDRSVREQEQLWYELEITPNSHAHNDILHFAVVGGWASALSLLLFFIFIFRDINPSPGDRETLSPIGVGSLWVAGFFQCYLLDDEVALPFYALSGILIGSRRSQEKAGFRFTALLLVLPFLLNACFWIWRLRTPPTQAYSRQIRTENPDYGKLLEKRILPFRSEATIRQNRILEKVQIPNRWAEMPFQIEGCLTHRWPNPPSPRKGPFRIGIYLSPNAENPPKQASVTVVSRESFDEDQLYWSQAQVELGSERITLKSGWNSFLWKETIPFTSSPKFPTGVFFRDFKIVWEGFRKDKDVDLPAFDFGDLCDYE